MPPGLFYADNPRWRLPPAALVPRNPRPGDLGPVGNSLYALGSVLDEIGQRVKTQKDKAKLDDLANSLALSGQIPGVDPDTWKGGGMDEAQFRLSTALGGALPSVGGKGAPSTRIGAPKVSKATTPDGLTPGQRAVQSRYDQNQARLQQAAEDRKDQAAQNALGQALKGLQPDTADKIAAAIPGGLTQEQLDARTGQEPGPGQDVKFTVPEEGTNYHVADNIKAALGLNVAPGQAPLTGFQSPSPNSREVTVASPDLASYLDRRNALEQGTPMLANPKGGFVAADKYLQMLAQSNPKIREALARDAQIRARGLSDTGGGGTPTNEPSMQQLSDDGTDPLPSNPTPLFAQPDQAQAAPQDDGAAADAIRQKYQSGEMTREEAKSALSQLNL